MGEKNARKIVFQKHTHIASYKRWKKIVWKKCENTFFLKTHEYCYQKWGEKIRVKIFQETHRFRK